ncbi:MAG: class I SAM-dependent methyltransferase [Phycisphaerales bacterium]
MSLSPQYQRDWPAYFDAVADQPPRDTLLRALAAFDAERALPTAPAAIDLACGEGRDTRAILASGPSFHVHAVDNSPDALSRLRARLTAAQARRVTPVALALEHVADRPHLFPAHAHLINASFALPFCHEDHFPRLWAWITSTLLTGGRFSGQIFGDRDEWAAVNPRRHFTRVETLDLLSPFHIEHFEEVEKDGSDATGGTKHHHLFHIVARKRA